MTPDPTVLSAEAPPVLCDRALAIRWEALQPAADASAGLHHSALVIRIDPTEDVAAEGGHGFLSAWVCAGERGGDRDHPPTDARLEERRRVDLHTVRTDGGVHADLVNGSGELLLAISLASDGRLLFARTPLLERAGFGPGATLPPVLEG